MHRMRCVAAGAGLIFAACAGAANTHNILITGYWPPTNNMVRPFSTNPAQNPGGWIGGNWENRGYNIYSYFPEFPNGEGKGVGDFEVDYQDTSSDWWRITNVVKPVAIITFSRGSLGSRWEIENVQRNLQTWIDDYEAPFQPTPSPPDASVPANFVRYSSLPMVNIRNAVNSAGLGVNAFIDQTGGGGGFVSEFMAYHGTWYKSLHDTSSDPDWCVAAGHIHVGTQVTTAQGFAATKISLRELITYVNTQLPTPGTVSFAAFGMLLVARRRRS